MPVHDWTRVISGIFHDFHQRWITGISNCLNDGRMPKGYYALTEQVTDGPRPDVIALEARSSEDAEFERGDPDDRAIAVLEYPPKLRFTAEQERDIYAAAADRIAVRHASGDQVVAYIEIISPGNKHSPLELQRLFDKLNEALDHGIHVTLIDVHPPGKHDPRGVHAAFWEFRAEETHGVTSEEPLGFSAYRCDECPHGYFERVAIGGTLPDMPVFLTSRHYLNIPLEQTYMETYRGVPERWKQVIEGRAES